MKLTIYSPEKTVFDGEVELCEVPGTKGRFTILRDHDSIITTLQPGNVAIVKIGEKSVKIIITVR